jgi:hypothetical protein
MFPHLSGEPDIFAATVLLLSLVVVMVVPESIRARCRVWVVALKTAPQRMVKVAGSTRAHPRIDRRYEKELRGDIGMTEKRWRRERDSNPRYLLR